MSWDGKWIDSIRFDSIQVYSTLLLLQWTALSRICGLSAPDGGQGGIRGAVQGLSALLDTHGAVVAHLLVVLRADTQNDWRLQLLSQFRVEGCQWDGKGKRDRGRETKMQSILRQMNHGR